MHLLLFLILLAFCSSSKEVVVLCVGDSITAGSGASDNRFTSYPPLLERFLNEYDHEGNRYITRNFGVGGTTITKFSLTDDGKRSASYWETKEYRHAVKETGASIVIIAFGTNDAKNWNEKIFIKNYIEFINIFKNSTIVQRQIYLFVPPPLYLPVISTMRPDIVNYVLPSAIRRITELTNVQLIDIFKRMGGTKLSRPHLFINETKKLKPPNDGCHPNDRGYRVIALTASEAILKHNYKGISSDIEETPLNVIRAVHKKVLDYRQELGASSYDP
jgi:lysophospholipase L1-like esterase